MASIGNDNGLRRILFVDGEVRRTVRLGRVSAKIAESIKIRIESILASRRAGFPLDAEVASWLGSIDDTLHGRLAAAKLVPERTSASLSSFAVPTHANLGTRATVAAEMARVTEFFGNIDVRTVTPKMAADFRDQIDACFSPSTVGKTIQRARSMFADAVERRVITTNPFASIEAPGCQNRERIQFVAVATIERVMAVCPDDAWRTRVALSRFGGLRCPSEVNDLESTDIDFRAGTIRIRKHKTRERLIPLFGDLRPYLEACPVPAPLTRTQYRCGLLRLLKWAELDPWPRIWHNLRASRQTDLEDEFPSQVVCEWMGNSIRVGLKHYLSVTDEHMRRAAQKMAHRQDSTRSGKRRGKVG